MNNERVHFGGYDWIVLDRQDGKALLLSEEILFLMPFNIGVSNAWSLSSIRKFLNGEFNNSMMESVRSTHEDLTRIVETVLETPANPWFGTKGCSNTHDRIFLLSLEEVLRYFGDSGDLAGRRDWKYSDMPNEGLVPAHGNGDFISDAYNEVRTAIYNFKHTIPPTGPHQWWLRSPGRDVPYSDLDPYTAVITFDGMISVAGAKSCIEDGGVRPAMWLKV